MIALSMIVSMELAMMALHHMTVNVMLASLGVCVMKILTNVKLLIVIAEHVQIW
jgi:hypothetical protein